MFYTLKYLWVIDRARSHHLNLLGIFGWGLHLQLGLKYAALSRIAAIEYTSSSMHINSVAAMQLGLSHDQVIF